MPRERCLHAYMSKHWPEQTFQQTFTQDYLQAAFRKSLVDYYRLPQHN